MGILCWIEFGKELPITKLMVEGDSKCANDLIQKQDVVHHISYSLINSIKKLLAEIGDTAVDHIFREANSCTDTLTRQGEFHETGIGFFESPHSFSYPSHPC
ncbi:hypothetical protein AHAS_Ahas19G0259700 [Arachis hypogaea]